ncbi:MAG: SGNH/GDSL hydrolase family protein [Acidimicrobiia bacterium]|nr:SGNH/GDSL hydrolase family protein [Acidimicrobiia bacterium]
MNGSTAGTIRTRFLALGDSYTVGESVAVEESWPGLLAVRLSLEPTVLATTAWTSGELLEAFDRSGPAGTYGLVSLQIGVNDQYRGLSLDEFVANWSALLVRARSVCDDDTGGVLAVSIPDWGVTPFATDRDGAGVAADIDRFNEALGAMTVEACIPLVDVTSISRAHPSLVAPDGLHPSGEQYRRWVEEIAPVAEAVLGRRDG